MPSSNPCAGTGAGSGTNPVPTDYGSSGFSGGGLTVPDPATLTLLGVGLMRIGFSGVSELVLVGTND